MKKEIKKVPTIRFKEFTDDWEQRKLGNVTEELSDYDNLSSGLPLLTSARTGIMYQSDYRGNCTTDNEKTLFSVVPLNACTYRHMSDDSTFHININTLEKGLVSREYPVFVGKKCDLRYIVRYINSSNSFIKFCTEQKKGGTRTRLYYKTLCKYQMLFPSLDEQHIIANYFEALDNLITLHQRKLKQLQTLKKYFLQNMFPAKEEKVPAIRFKGFTDDWEQRKLPDLLKKSTGAMKIGPFGSALKKDIYVSRGIKVYAQENIFKDDFSIGNYYITENKYKELQSCELFSGDIVISMMGTIGACAVFPEHAEKGIMNSHLLRLQFGNDMLPEFVKLLLRDAPSIKIEMEKLSVGTIMTGLSSTVIKKLNLPVTSIEEQKKISAFFTALDKSLTLQQRKINQLQSLKKFMLQNLFI